MPIRVSFIPIRTVSHIPSPQLPIYAAFKRWHRCMCVDNEVLLAARGRQAIFPVELHQHLRFATRVGWWVRWFWCFVCQRTPRCRGKRLYGWRWAESSRLKERLEMENALFCRKRFARSTLPADSSAAARPIKALHPPRSVLGRPDDAPVLLTAKSGYRQGADCPRPFIQSSSRSPAAVDPR